MAALLLLGSRGLAADTGEVLLRQKLPAMPGWITVDAEAGGKKCLLLVDTGAGRTFMDNGLRDIATPESGTISFGDANGRQAEVKIYRVPKLQVQSLVAKDLAVLLQDFGPFSKLFGRKLGGAVGMDLLKAGKVSVNYDEAALEVHTGPWKLGETESTQSELEDYRDIPVFEMTIAGRHGELVVDTGANRGISLEASLFTALVRNGTIEVSTVQGHGRSANGPSTEIIGWFLKGELMGKDLTGVSVNSVGGLDGAGILGAEWLCGFNIELDFRSHQWRYQKRLHPQPPMSIDLMLGAILSYPGTGAQVERLRPDGGGAAEKAGLRQGDVIEGFDSLRGDQLNSAAVAEVVAARAGKRIEIQYLRAADGQRMNGFMDLPAPILEWNFAGLDIFKKQPASVP